MYVCTYVCIYVRMNVGTYGCMYGWTSACTYVCNITYIYLFIFCGFDICEIRKFAMRNIYLYFLKFNFLFVLIVF